MANNENYETIKIEMENISDIYCDEFTDTTQEGELPSFKIYLISNMESMQSLQSALSLTVKFTYTKKYPSTPYILHLYLYIQ